MFNRTKENSREGWISAILESKNRIIVLTGMSVIFMLLSGEILPSYAHKCNNTTTIIVNSAVPGSGLVLPLPVEVLTSACKAHNKTHRKGGGGGASAGDGGRGGSGGSNGGGGSGGASGG